MEFRAKQPLETSYDISQIPPFVVRAGGKIMDTQLINLSANESPFGPSPLAVEAIKNTYNSLNRYPDANGLALRSKLAKKFKQ